MLKNASFWYVFNKKRSQLAVLLTKYMSFFHNICALFEFFCFGIIYLNYLTDFILCCFIGVAALKLQQKKTKEVFLNEKGN